MIIEINSQNDLTEDCDRLPSIILDGNTYDEKSQSELLEWLKSELELLTKKNLVLVNLNNDSQYSNAKNPERKMWEIEMIALSDLIAYLHIKPDFGETLDELKEWIKIAKLQESKIIVGAIGYSPQALKDKMVSDDQKVTIAYNLEDFAMKIADFVDDY